MEKINMPKPWLMTLKEKFEGKNGTLAIIGLTAILVGGIVYLLATIIKENGSVRRIQVTGETIKDIGEAFFE